MEPKKAISVYIVEDYLLTRITYKKAFQDFNGIKALHGPFLDLKPSSPDRLIQSPPAHG